MKQMTRAQSVPVLFIYLILHYTLQSWTSVVLHVILLKETILLQAMLPNANRESHLPRVPSLAHMILFSMG